MKKPYETPKLVIHGTVERMTQAFGSAAAADTIIYGAHIFGNGGSQDGIVIPE